MLLLGKLHSRNFPNEWQLHKIFLEWCKWCRRYWNTLWNTRVSGSSLTTSLSSLSSWSKAGSLSSSPLSSSFLSQFDSTSVVFFKQFAWCHTHKVCLPLATLGRSVPNFVTLEATNTFFKGWLHLKQQTPFLRVGRISASSFWNLNSSVEMELWS